MNTQFKKGALELCVLSLLSGGDMYGYELTERVSREMSIAGGTLYPILKKLKEEGRVDTYLVESDSGPARKYYRLTESGRAYGNALRAEWTEFVLAVDALLGAGESSGGAPDA